MAGRSIQDLAKESKNPLKEIANKEVAGNFEQRQQEQIAKSLRESNDGGRSGGF